MGVLRTLCLGIFVTLISAQGIRADGALLNRVSECVGRLSAQMEHHWLFQDEPTDHIERQRALLIDILQALITSDTAAWALSARIDAKMAHAALLTQAAFGQDVKVTEWARRRAKTQILMCNGIALSPPSPQTHERRNDVLVQGATLSQEAWNASQ